MHFILKMTALFFCAFSGGLLLAQNTWYFTPGDVNSLHSKKADFRIPYGKDPQQFGDLRLPDGSQPHPVAIIIHGGCWISKFATLQNTAALSDALRECGIATWNIEYRATDQSGGGWPGTFTDVGQAADYLREIAKMHGLDLNHVIVIGHSAGGHLALWLSSRHKLPKGSALYVSNPLHLQGALVLGGVPDLKAFRNLCKTVCGEDVIERLLGGNDERYREISPQELLPLGTPQILVYGAEDRAVPPALGRSYAEAAREKGDMCALYVVKNAAHHEHTAPNSITWPLIKSAAFSLLQGTMIKEPSSFQCLIE
jgi:acetyl esterase/lipase